jgi:hypothetical protein
VLVLEVTSVALVVIGIAGELFVDWKSDDLQTRLRDANGSLVLKLEQSAGEAKDSAKAAAADATTAKGAAAGAVTASGNALTLATGARKEADAFKGEIVSANKLAADAESHLADALKQAAQAKEQTVEAEKQLLELQNELRPRRLTAEQKAKFSLLLRGKESEPIAVANCWSSAECIDFANDIGDALKDANWIPTFVPYVSSTYGIEVGCYERRSENRPQSAARAGLCGGVKVVHRRI